MQTYRGSKYHETYFLPYQMFLTVKRCIHTKFGWIWSSDHSAHNKFSFKSVENWNFAGQQKASKQAETDDVLNRSEPLTSWEFKIWCECIFWQSKTSDMVESKFLDTCFHGTVQFKVENKQKQQPDQFKDHFLKILWQSKSKIFYFSV